MAACRLSDSDSDSDSNDELLLPLCAVVVVEFKITSSSSSSFLLFARLIDLPLNVVFIFVLFLRQLFLLPRRRRCLF